MIYLTYNDQPSGVFSSQVNDVCNYLNKTADARIKLVAIISLHQFMENRRKIRKEVPDALVLPALPKAKYWKFSILVVGVICLLTGQRQIISRNIMATLIALRLKKAGLVKKVCLDGRGAIAAEWNEYQVVPDENMKKAIFGQEKEAVLESDFRIAVSSKLVNYWKTSFGYAGNNHVVIPCTLGSDFEVPEFTDNAITNAAAAQGFAKNDLVMIYSGSTAGWQSFAVLGDILGKVLKENPTHRLLFLAKEDENISKMKADFPGQVSNKWVGHKEVQQVLMAGDYGILYRENSVTNQVASPTKLAEYLAAGLPVIISDNLGDYSDFVKNHQCGNVIGPGQQITLAKTVSANKLRMAKLAETHFTKKSQLEQYNKLIAFMNKN
ncbi:MAG: hypothetical protein IPG39_22875 [Bacteroidetes bacterium]|nr:hypothetical protein [Bacteroidota bacterium]